MIYLLSALFGFTLATGTPQVDSPAIPQENWIAMKGDRLIVDTKENMGYIAHDNGAYLAFKLATGQKRVVRYLGITYNAATPNRRWTVLSTHIQPDRTTFGPSGLFLRLYHKDERTSYGIHSHKSIAKMLEEEKRYESMGCVLVTDEILAFLTQAYYLNGNTLDVVTVNGVDTSLLAQAETAMPGF